MDRHADRDQTLKFFKWLLSTSSDRTIVYQAFGEGIYKDTRGLTKVLIPTSSDNKLATIDVLQAKGAGIFVQVQGGKLRGNKHIETIRGVFVDLDGEPLSTVTDAVREGFPKPSLVVESSRKAPGGARYHVYWTVDDVTIANYGYIQKALAQRFGGDPAVHDLSRIMRLPGTRNFKYDPDGELVRVIHSKPQDAVHADLLLEKCTQVSDHLPDREVTDAEVAQLAQSLSTLESSLVMDAYDKEPTSEITELKPGDRTEKIIRIAGRLVGENPDDSPAEIKKLLVREVERLTPSGTKGPNASAWRSEIFPAVDRFVERQRSEVKAITEKASLVNTEYTEEFEAFHASRDHTAMTLADFSARFLLVTSTRQVFDLTKSPAQAPSSIDAFKTYAQVFREEGAPVFNKWIKNRALRRSVDKLSYRPFKYTADDDYIKLQRIVRDDDTDELCFNRYAVPQLKPIASVDKSVYNDYIDTFLNHINYLMATPAKAEVMLDWMAATIQRPEQRVTWAPLIITRYEGVGKGWLGQVLKLIVGPTNFSFVTADEFDKQVQYNDFLVDCTLLVIDEVYAPRRADIKNRLNAVITEPMMEVNRKFGTKQRERIYCNTIAFSNHPDALALTITDRRFFVTINKSKPKSASYYNKLFNWLNGGIGPAILMHWLLKRDISKFNWGECPRVDGDVDKLAMQTENLSDIEELLESMMSEGEGPFEGAVICKRFLFDYILQHASIELSPQAQTQAKRWLKVKGTTVGKISGLPSTFRHQTFYVMDHALNYRKDKLVLVAEARKSLKGTYGDSTLYLVESEG